MIVVKVTSEEHRRELIVKGLAEGHKLLVTSEAVFVAESAHLVVALLHRLATGLSRELKEQVGRPMNVFICLGRDAHDTPCIGFAFNTDACTVIYGVTEQEFNAEMANHTREPPNRLQ